jgi:hypothetical protein
MKRKSVLGLALAVSTLLFARNAAAGVLFNGAEPFEQAVSVPCANGGAGEDVLLTGFIHVLITGTLDASGSLHTTTHFQPMGVSGVGLTTGDVYRATGLTRDQANGLDVPFEETFVNNFRIIGPGKGNNLLIQEIAHVTFDANGQLTVLFDFVSEGCR